MLRTISPTSLRIFYYRFRVGLKSYESYEEKKVFAFYREICMPPGETQKGPTATDDLTV